MYGIQATRLSWLFALFVAIPALAYDETLLPKSDIDGNTGANVADNGCSNACDSAFECFEMVDDDVDSPDGNIISGTGTGEQWYGGFDAPADPPSTAGNAQRFRVNVTKCNDSCVESLAGGDPDIYVFLGCGGIQERIIYGPVTIDGDSGAEIHDVDWTFDTDGNCNADGSNVEIGLNIHGAGGGPNKRHTCWNAAEWLTTKETARQRYRVID